MKVAIFLITVLEIDDFKRRYKISKSMSTQLPLQTYQIYSTISLFLLFLWYNIFIIFGWINETAIPLGCKSNHKIEVFI